MKLEIASVDQLQDTLRSDGASIDTATNEASVRLHFTVVQVTSDLEVSLMNGATPGVSALTQAPHADSPDRVVLDLHRSRPVSAHQFERDARSVVLQPDEAYIYDMRQHLTVENPDWSDHLGVAVDRRALAAAVGGRLPIFVPFTARSPLMRVLTAMVRETIASGGDGLDTAALDHLGQTTIDLLGAAVRSAVDGHAVNPSGRSGLLRTILADVDDRLGDPDLGPPELAARAHISLRYLHSLFQDIDTTAAAYIREQRLNRADRRLADAAQAHVPILTIAYSLGFSDPSTFSRAYRRHFGVSASDRRAASRLTATSQSLSLESLLTHPDPRPNDAGVLTS